MACFTITFFTMNTNTHIQVLFNWSSPPEFLQNLYRKLWKVPFITQPPVSKQWEELREVAPTREITDWTLLFLNPLTTLCSEKNIPFYRQHCAQRKPAGIKFTQRPILRFFAPQGRHVAPIGVKFGTEEGTAPCQISPPPVQRQGCRTPKIKIFTQIWPKCEI